ncbi:MAG: SsrA-binding protein SmpB [bacterium]|jgi:SsrA-binding protein|nr:SsrA-binding protein SmpB [bacterium]
MKKKKETGASTKTAATNRKARHEYHILESFEAGVVLQGTEIKSIRQGKVNLQDSFAQIDRGEVYLMDCHISPYDHGGYVNHDPKRPRKLLLHKKEIIRLFGKLQTKGFTLVPLKIYFVRGKAKVQLALARGKKLFDKREDIKRRDMDREMERAKSMKYI